MAFELPSLKYSYDALEPHIDSKTMEIHHGKHHAGYTNNLNNAIKDSDLEGKSIEEILSNLNLDNSAVRNNGGGFYNHCLFWNIMSPNGGGAPNGEIAEAINTKFGNFEDNLGPDIFKSGVISHIVPLGKSSKTYLARKSQKTI